MSKPVRPYLRDIVTAIGRAESLIEDRSLAEYGADWVLRYAVERAIEIISEAVRRLPPEATAGHPDIP